MANRKKDKKQGQLYVAGTAFKDLVPSWIKIQPREGQSAKVVDIEEDYVEISNDVEYLGHLPEWPGDEAAEEHDFGLDLDPEAINFTCLDKWKLPASFVKDQRL